MPVAAALRYVRAAVFAAVCVAVSAAGHVLMSGTGLPVWASAAAAMAVFAAATLAAHKERSLTAITAGVLTVQGALHLFFSRVQQGGAAENMVMRPPAAPARADLWASRMMCSGHSRSADPAPGLPGRSMRHVVPDAGLAPGSLHTHAMPSMHHSGTGMIAAHLAAALVCAWWLHRGERTAFALLRTLRTAADRTVHRLLALFAAGPTAPLGHCAPHRIRQRAATIPPQLPLVRHTLIRRGPPLSFSY
ncbi:hypothetical protein [Streptomyces chattanoogensis]|uniref:hypothetical protein n=1 Tax=Streptomyces chattanoogensis TaxID=66876 RepID=UPI0006B421BB|nr:hypothetical protein [Streptomyces chattanoogensis]